MRIDSAGNVGIGTSAPDAPLAISQSADSTGIAIFGYDDMSGNRGSLSINASGYTQLRSHQDRGMDFHSGESAASQFRWFGDETQWMVLTAAGRVGIGTTVPNMMLNVHGTTSTETTIGISNSSTGNARIYFDASNGDFSGSDYGWVGQDNNLNMVIASASATDADILFSPDDTEKMRISANGQVSIGTTSTPGGMLNIKKTDDQTGIRITSSGSGITTGNRFIDFMVSNFNDAHGMIISTGSADNVTFASWSDERMKDNISNLTGQLALLKKLKPRKWKWKKNGNDGIGFVAQELETVFPECVGTEDEPFSEDDSEGKKYIGSWYPEFARVVSALIEVSDKNDALEVKVKALEDA
jgi:hypothetical protein